MMMKPCCPSGNATSNSAPVRCAAILAGGLSTRMGREKALLPFQGQTLIAHTTGLLQPLFERLVIVTNNPEVADAAGVPFLADRFTRRGPLGGIHAALSYMGEPTFIVACDMPFLNRAFIQHLKTQFANFETAPDVLVPRSENGIEPLHAIFAPSCLPVFEPLLQNDTARKTPSLRFVLSQLNAVFVAEDVAQSYGVRFENWNTPDDLNTPR